MNQGMTTWRGTATMKKDQATKELQIVENVQ